MAGVLHAGPDVAGRRRADRRPRADYYALADSQIVMGPRATVRRLAESPVPLYLAAYAEGEVDLDRVGRLATTAFQRVTEYFGSASRSRTTPSTRNC